MLRTSPRSSAQASGASAATSITQDEVGVIVGARDRRRARLPPLQPQPPRHAHARRRRRPRARRRDRRSRTRASAPSAWMIGSMLAGLSGVLLAPKLNLDVTLLAGLVVAAFAVAASPASRACSLVILGALILAYMPVGDRHPPDPRRRHRRRARSCRSSCSRSCCSSIRPRRRRVRVVGGGMRRQLRERASGNVVDRAAADRRSSRSSGCRPQPRRGRSPGQQVARVLDRGALARPPRRRLRADLALPGDVHGHRRGPAWDSSPRAACRGASRCSPAAVASAAAGLRDLARRVPPARPVPRADHATPSPTRRSSSSSRTRR